MSKRNSGYRRKPRDNYPTPVGPLAALLDVLPMSSYVYECCPGAGKLAAQLYERGYGVLTQPNDFLKVQSLPPQTRAIITNPPFNIAHDIICHALRLMAEHKKQCTMAMLLPADYDHANRRTYLFRDCLAFAGQVKLNRRIVWFKPKPPKRAGPSEWHSWFIWDNRRSPSEPPWVRYSTWNEERETEHDGEKHAERIARRHAANVRGNRREGARAV